MPIRLLGAAFALLLASCGVAFAGSPFEGRWERPWTSQQGISGTFALTIDANGAVSGTTVYADNHGTVSGRIDASGRLEARYSYGVITYRAEARVALEGGHLRGSATYSLPLGVAFDHWTVDLARR